MTASSPKTLLRNRTADSNREAGGTRTTPLLILFGLTIFLSAFLLFQVQLIIGKYILPWFGGTPAVFTACILFFQTLLLVGYCYSHVIVAKLSAWPQTIVHSIVTACAAAWLVYHWHAWNSPLLPDGRWKPNGVERPCGHVTLLLLVSAGIPYFVVSTTGPLLQAWYSRVSDKIPYRLYALSNAGSLLALISYPFVVEPWLRLRSQAALWGEGFILFAFCCVITAVFSGNRGAHCSAALDVMPKSVASAAWKEKFLWLLLAATASLSLLATTNQICQDVAAVPLLWVLPLSLYLVSFIFCFSSEHNYSRTIWSAGLGVAAVLVCFATYEPELRIVYLIGIYSFAMFAICMVCHGELYKLRPATQYLTAFYIFVAVGGVIGGIVVSIIAPVLFKGYWEFPLSLWVALAMFCVVLLRDRTSWIYIPRPLLLAFAMITVFAGPVLAKVGTRPLPIAISLVIVGLLTAFFLSGGSSTPRSFATQRRAALISTCAMLFIAGGVIASPIVASVLETSEITRNFYGVLSVTSQTNEGLRIRKLQHGRVLHGMQIQDEARRRQPTSYYSVDSGIGQVLTSLTTHGDRQHLRMGVVGLGVGTIAAYGRPGDYIRFYEINPEVIRLASSGPRGMFTFIADSPARVEIVPGDARLTLEQELNRDELQNFDVLAIDAFSGDAIPVHLLTEEAFHLYLRHLKPDGILVFHISNQALDLSPVIARLAHEAGVVAWLARSLPTDPTSSASRWIIVSRRASNALVPITAKMRELSYDSHFPLWTDDYSNLFQVIAW